jgi:hypothetical protein
VVGVKQEVRVLTQYEEDGSADCKDLDTHVEREIPNPLRKRLAGGVSLTNEASMHQSSLLTEPKRLTRT